MKIRSEVTYEAKEIDTLLVALQQWSETLLEQDRMDEWEDVEVLIGKMFE